MTNEWNAGRPAAVNGPPGRRLLSAAERRQRNLVIALSVGGVLVLVAGMIAFVASQGGDDSSGPSTVLPTSVPTSESVTTTIEATTTTAVPTTTTPSTTVPLPANAEAGEDLLVDRAVEFMLVASNLAEGTPNAAVRWTQTSGPDVTAGVGSLRGSQAVAIAPANVSTLAFTLEVAGTDGVATDDVIVRVLEDADQAVFVDGERGDDAADGSITTPLRSLAAAVQSAPGRDVYVRSVGTYDATAASLELGDGMSIYGGFDENWMRDTNRRAVIDGAAIALRATGSSDRWLSAIEVSAGDALAGENSAGVLIQDAGTISVLDSRIVGGDGGAGVDGGPGGRSSGIFVGGATEVRIERSTVNAGRGGRGSQGVAVAAVAGTATIGGDAAGRDAGAGGGSGEVAGGRGGDGGATSSGSAAPGGGGAGGTAGSPNGQPGSGGSGGSGGLGGNGGVGSVTADDGATVPIGRAGVAGDVGSVGSGGLGGGGGNGPVLVNGGGGAGGGAGGVASAGAAPGGGGGGSIGLWTVGVERLVIVESLVAGGRGGDGGVGALAAGAETGGSGGRGAVGVDGVLADGGNGGGGGGGGAGGTGGQGGGGAGGDSFGMLTTRVVIVEISASTVRGGGGGNGAAGGVGGAPGLGGADGSGRNGGVGGAPSDDVNAEAGVGASGGSSYGWFDDNAANQIFDDAEFIEGNAGTGGTGSTRGDDGFQISTNV